MIWTSVRSCSLYPIEMESSDVLSSLSMEDWELRAEGMLVAPLNKAEYLLE